jgi:hypothetical protein
VSLGGASQVLCCIELAEYVPQVLNLNIDGYDLCEEKGEKTVFFM